MMIEPRGLRKKGGGGGGGLRIALNYLLQRRGTNRTERRLNCNKQREQCQQQMPLWCDDWGGNMWRSEEDYLKEMG